MAAHTVYDKNDGSATEEAAVQADELLCNIFISLQVRCENCLQTKVAGTNFDLRRKR